MECSPTSEQSTGVMQLDGHQAQADLDRFVYPLHRLRREMPPISSHAPLVYGSDLIQEHNRVVVHTTFWRLDLDLHVIASVTPRGEGCHDQDWLYWLPMSF